MSSKMQNTNDTETGVVRFWEPVRGYGFISADLDNVDLYTDDRMIKGRDGFKALMEGQVVRFRRSIGDCRGRQQLQAVGVVPMQIKLRERTH